MTLEQNKQLPFNDGGMNDAKFKNQDNEYGPFKRSEMRTECSKNNSPAPLVTLLSWLARTAVSAMALP